tara:strand:- start:66 stop:221 length:156 start_codon:yes stop_codon:yes gene_type:complete
MQPASICGTKAAHLATVKLTLRARYTGVGSPFCVGAAEIIHFVVFETRSHL